MSKTIDPIYTPSVLDVPDTMFDDLDFDALTKTVCGLQGVVDPKPKTAAIILAGFGRAFRSRRRQAARRNRREAHSHLVGRGV